MTDSPARQDKPDNENGGPSSDSTGSVEENGQNLPAPQWSAEQPAPAPWFLGQPGPVPPQFPPPLPYPPVQGPPAQGSPGQVQYPPVPMPPPTPDQAAWPNHAPGTRPEPPAQQVPQGGPAGQQGESAGPQDASRPQAQNPNQPQPQPQPQPGTVPAAGPPRKPGQSPGPALGPNGSPNQPAPWFDPNNPPQPAPWHDPNRYNQPDQRPQQHDPRSPYRPPQPPRQPQQQPRGEEPERRPPLSLRTRWARGLAVGGAACTLMTLLTGYRNFPDWLIGACAGLLMSLGGLWFGTFAQRDALRNAQRAPEAIASVVWSSISSLIALAIVSYSLIFFPQLRQYSDCMRAANTIAGQNVCQQEFENSLAALP